MRGSVIQKPTGSGRWYVVLGLAATAPAGGGRSGTWATAASQTPSAA